MLEEKILTDYKEAMKNKDSLRSGILSFLRAQFMNLVLEKKKNKLDDADCMSVIRKLIKQHQDSIEQFTKGSRLDLVDKEAKEMEILKSYLPKELGPDEVKKLIEEAISLTGAAGMKDMGKVMKEVMSKAAGACDNKLVSDLIRQKLTD
ncbi:MAG: GatB/YqeY domain-containing protein [Candidatus Omnitrophota bacterium]|nr:GatB/YqeY domain-containing protein [Candidatus Omnitrophota bacterium]MBU1929712.1 GatB/YqeY domain-containing protein [Candidatus Omnitrophota bacterium]MBU2035110.1 GatB/YqeY domain-containing protein [Candidatus Omnitrophota bacterium]MBU2258727.1 GatB/YqeY domain-containing protein [Candidatus Omnitrophota bacterium]